MSARQLHNPRQGSTKMILLVLLAFASFANFRLLPKLSLYRNLDWYSITQDMKKKMTNISPTIYNNIQLMPEFLSSGPHDVNPGINGLYEFQNVCLIPAVTDESSYGLVYFKSPDDAIVLNNPRRCMPCSMPIMHGWDAKGRDEGKFSIFIL